MTDQDISDMFVDNVIYETDFYKLLYKPIPNEDTEYVKMVVTPGMKQVNNFIPRVERSHSVKKGKVSTGLISIGTKQIYIQIIETKIDISEYRNNLALAQLSKNIFVRDHVSTISLDIFHGLSVNTRVIENDFHYLDTLAEIIGISKSSMIAVAYWIGYSVMCLENSMYDKLKKTNSDVNNDVLLSIKFINKFIDFNDVLMNLKHAGFLYDV